MGYQQSQWYKLFTISYLFLILKIRKYFFLTPIQLIFEINCFSGLADATLTNLGSIPSISNMQPPAPLPNLPGIPMNQPQPYIPMMPNYSPSQAPPAAAYPQTAPSLVPTFDMSSFAQAPIQPPPISAGLALVTPVSLPGMPPITVSATLPVSTMQEIHQQQTLQHQDLLSWNDIYLQLNYIMPLKLLLNWFYYFAQILFTNYVQNQV